MFFKPSYFVIGLIIILLCSFKPSEPITGTYWGPNKKSKIQFFKKNDQYFGKLIWTNNPSLIDENNQTKSLKGRNLVGLNLFFSLKYNSHLKVWKGKFYDPTSGEIYNCDLWLTNSNKSLVARGYSDYSFLTQTETLQRVEKQ